MSDSELISIDWQVIEELDLELIKVKLMDKEEGLGWSSDRCDEAEKWYKRFLYLHKKNPSSPLVPVNDMDRFWHQHILDTEKYAKDCDKIFGYFLHHFPYFGMRGGEDAANLKRAAEETSNIFEKEYGESPYGGFNKSSSRSNCSSPSKCTPTCFPYSSCSPR